MSRRDTLRLAEALEREAHRARREARAHGHPRPYFVSYLLRDFEQHWFQGRFGTLFGSETRRWRRCFADVRVGSYRTDHVRDGGLGDNSQKAESFSYSTLPIGARLDGVLHGVWQLTEARYREAAEELLDKQADSLHYRDENESLASFIRRDPTESVSTPSLPEVDHAHWERYVEAASAVAKKLPGVYGCDVELTVRHSQRVLVSTEGTRVVDRLPLWQVLVSLDLMSAKGVSVPWTLSHFVTRPEELPPLDALKAEIKRAIGVMRAIADAPTLRAYSGPVLLGPRPAGLLMHEALGHRLEGSRLLSSGEGQTFKDSLGESLLPEAISMRDDPTIESWQGRSLVGHYLHDDEGVAATSASLVSRGQIEGYLTTRQAIAKRHASNGHARNESYERPMSRMGVTIVEAERPLDEAALKRRLIEEVKRRKLPFGIHVIDADSGETATKSYDFQAFLGEIRAATRVFPDGREEYVRDVSFVGTPLNAIRSIVAAGARHEVDNAYCGAESGAVPVSTISPALLVESLELQSSARQPNAPHTYPMPWEDEAAEARR
ncbi:MAG: hypothetical protein KF729_18670 [Sandaracinaceae bacterium]|nr:hypothetical protein [Sandaracinaceae bacterium]